MTLCEDIDRRLSTHAARQPFLVVDGTLTDYATMADRLRRLFGLFAGMGLRPGDRIAILSRDVLAVSTLVLGALRSGIAVVTLNPDLSAPDADTALRSCRLTHLFADQAVLDRIVVPQGLAVTAIRAPEAAAGLGGLLGRLRAIRAVEEGFAADLAAAVPQDPPPPPDADATALMLFTSGTTSAPKVVELSHANIAAQIAAFRAVFDHDADARVLNPLPLHFTDGMLHGPIFCYLAGATLYRPTRFDFQKIEELMDGIYRDRITHFIVVPALLSIMDRLGDAFAQAFEGGDFRYIRCSGDLLPEALWRATEARFGVRVVNTFGMSETVCEALYAGPDDATRRPGTIGRPVGCEIAIVDEDGQPVAPGEAGELLIRGGIVMKGYLDQPDLTAAAIRDGWLQTGDFAAMDPDGLVRIVGRKKSLIITGGINVQPQDIADCLLTHPAVAEAAGFGQPHPRWGEQVAAAVRLREGHTATARDLIGHCEALLSPHKVPRLVLILPELPRNAAGKVLIEPLRAEIARQDQSAGSIADLDVSTQVIRLAARVFSVAPDDLHPTSEPANTLGWDSLAHLTLIAAVEDAFGLRFAASEVLRIHRLSDLSDLVLQSRRG